ncbi:hypothetical protein [Cylindrospermum sp. FACHB-282]|uniref:hypothetical protein n=1 Tax=Cylindrospermum sp. FACHB-282 TaxID=2692794 RepID=UPI00168702BB|nr:hypothetical protein [Cylindrospermum sp. FACHB-282]MBD2388846.1 hypothetical protein [Cylindrospermum sp. FACHB-282]
MTDYLIGQFFSNNFSSNQVNALLGISFNTKPQSLVYEGKNNQLGISFNTKPQSLVYEGKNNQLGISFNTKPQSLVYEGKNNQLGAFYLLLPAIGLEDRSIRPQGSIFASAFSSFYPKVQANEFNLILQSRAAIGATVPSFSPLFLSLLQPKDFSFLNSFSSEIAEVQVSELVLDWFIQTLTIHQELFGANYSETINEIRIRKSELLIRDNLNALPAKLFAGLFFKAKIAFRESEDIKITFWKNKPIFVKDESGYRYKYFAAEVTISEDLL